MCLSGCRGLFAKILPKADRWLCVALILACNFGCAVNRSRSGDKFPRFALSELCDAARGAPPVGVFLGAGDFELCEAVGAVGRFVIHAGESIA